MGAVNANKRRWNLEDRIDENLHTNVYYEISVKKNINLCVMN